MMPVFGHAALINTVTEIDGTSTDGGSSIVTAPNLMWTATLNSTGFDGFNGANIASLKNGSIGGTGESTTALEAGAISGDGFWTLNVAFDTSLATFGYNLTNIKVISTWGGGFASYSSAWVSQSYSLLYSTAADPTNFISLGAYSALVQQSSGEHIMQTSLTNGGTIFPNGIANLQFQFTPIDSGYQGGGTGNAISEIEAFGVAAVPEPGTGAMLLVGLSVLAVRCRNRRNS